MEEDRKEKETSTWFKQFPNPQGEKNMEENKFRPRPFERVHLKEKNMETLQRVTSEATGQFGTYGWSKGKRPHRVKSWIERFIIWIISKYLPNFHLAKNPPKGYKRSRKVKEINNEKL